MTVLKTALQSGATIGIIGGGQLARMLSIAASRLGFKTIILEPQSDCPAAQTTNLQIVAAYDDIIALQQLAQQCDVITYEFENVPSVAINCLVEQKTIVAPNPIALKISQDRIVEKEFLTKNDIKTAPFYQIDTAEDLKKGLIETKGKGILKTRRFGYDGKGQVRLDTTLTNLIENDIIHALDDIANAPAVLEGFIAFEKEISVIAARGFNGQIEFFDSPENVHKNGILHTSTVPASITKTTQEAAYNITKKILIALDYVGVIGVEFFVLHDGSILVNEIAPRVHNSGHWTEAACLISQFEQHIRAITGLPLGATMRHSNCVMENLIGNDIKNLPAFLTEKQTLIHLYGKTEIRDGRKMGHITRITSINS